VTRDIRNPEAAVHPSAVPSPLADPRGILASIGLVTYDWRIDSDVLSWGANAAEVLHIGDSGSIATGRGYAAYLDPKNAATRYDAVTQTSGPDMLVSIAMVARPSASIPCRATTVTVIRRVSPIPEEGSMIWEYLSSQFPPRNKRLGCRAM